MLSTARSFHTFANRDLHRITAMDLIERDLDEIHGLAYPDAKTRPRIASGG